MFDQIELPLKENILIVFRKWVSHNGKLTLEILLDVSKFSTFYFLVISGSGQLESSAPSATTHYFKLMPSAHVNYFSLFFVVVVVFFFFTFLFLFCSCKLTLCELVWINWIELNWLYCWAIKNKWNSFESLTPALSFSWYQLTISTFFFNHKSWKFGVIKTMNNICAGQHWEHLMNLFVANHGAFIWKRHPIKQFVFNITFFSVFLAEC